MNDVNLFEQYALNPLTDTQRQDAYIAARNRIAGKEPVLADYDAGHYSKYPPETVRLINWFTNAVMIAAFIPSAFRIYDAGFDAALQSFEQDYAIAAIIGICSVLFAEAGQIAFTLAAAKTDGWKSRWSLYIAAIACTAFALVGNAHVAAPWLHASAFAWFEAFMPPFLVVVAANVRKTQIMATIAAREAARNAYTSARIAWGGAFQNAHMENDWDRAVAIVLRDAIVQANKRSPARLRALDRSDWNALVRAERKSEEWYIVDEPATPVALPLPVEVPTQTQSIAETEQETKEVKPVRIASVSGRNSTALTGAIVNAQLIETENGWVKVCAACGFKTEAYANPRGATNALVAHQKKHRNEANALEAMSND